jgi:hypothetical protein
MNTPSPGAAKREVVLCLTPTGVVDQF